MRSMEEKLALQNEALAAQNKHVKSIEEKLTVANQYLEFLTSDLVQAKCKSFPSFNSKEAYRNREGFHELL